ncbi:LysR family transcriptional regulator [Glycomyces sp. TRM65418]|uniref:LysR family transcriptional regulator n=1 Tax=Glycomyces sp. TRM65418 TaxID=2867006 RepID=UPI001CE6283C|nr:LysR family transcriptional regulator [Glycomyces sp. TRM65418]MCC3765936.1 LysR family transcriptional regulator [Glycomyces sp. TRM65418]QZD55518.1 LysR family transcriptional regulator [Glycomyces sp. TRM65418]
MGGVERDEMEVFLTLSRELHFGRTAERLYLSQGRVSQLLRTLEDRIGGRLFERSSRRVALTELGEYFLAASRPAYEQLTAAFESARAKARGLDGRLRLGFVGAADAGLLETVPLFGRRHPGCELEMHELRLSDPFGPLHRGEVDLAFACLPLNDPELATGPVLASVPVVLGVSSAHPFASRSEVSAEELAECRMIDIGDPAPREWRERSSPVATPGGRPIPRGPVARTQHEALSQIATNRGVMVFCRNFAQQNRRDDLAFVPIKGLPDSRYSLVWHRDRSNALVRAFVDTAAEVSARRDRVQSDVWTG